MADKVKVGVIGSRFEADIHVASIKQMGEDAEVVAVASPTPGNAEKLREALRRATLVHRLQDDAGRARHRDGHDHRAESPALPDDHRHRQRRQARRLREAALHDARGGGRDDRAPARKKGVLLMYAEELFFTPKYVKAKEMADQGAFGDVYLVKQSEKHFGPHGDWFWDVEQSGGGVLMDMGCHGIAFCNWFLGRPKLEARHGAGAGRTSTATRPAARTTAS